MQGGKQRVLRQRERGAVNAGEEDPALVGAEAASRGSDQFWGRVGRREREARRARGQGRREWWLWS